MKLLNALTLYVTCAYRVITRFIYFPTFRCDHEIITLTDVHCNQNAPFYRICFVAWPNAKGWSPEEQSSFAIHAMNNSDSKLCDVYCTDVVNKSYNNHFMGTIKKGVEYDLRIDISTGNYKMCEVVVNVSPRTHYAPHTTKLTMPMAGKLGLLYKQ